MSISHETTESDRLKHFCETLCFTEEQIKDKDKVTEIDSSLEGLERMDVLSYFRKLTSITLCNQGIVQIEGLAGLTQLERLWLNDNLITKIKGLSKCTNLRCLYLTGNRITKIEGLEKLRKLEVLWLAENSITSITGVKKLVQLKDLNLASNKITALGTSLDSLTSLEELNLADNRIGNLKELLNLNRLPKLRVASFLDPHYGENPICGLCNYQTYVLYNLPKLEVLDMMETSDDAKALAEATFMKKRMFYNMKIKTMKRIASNLIKSVKACERIKRCEINKEIDFLMLQLKDCMREIEEGAYNISLVDAKRMDEMEGKKVMIHGKIYDKYEEINNLESICEDIKKRCYEVSENNIHRLITELETGGNIRFEEGRVSEKWFKSCTELLKSRFNPVHLKEFGEYSINITRVTRLHNRYLRNLFEEKLEQLIDICDKNLKKSLDYLFCSTAPYTFAEISKIIEEGFKHTPSSPIALANTLATADLPRLHQISHSPGKNLSSGSILMCKVYISNPVPDPANPTFNPTKPLSVLLEESPPSENPKGNCLFRLNTDDPSQKMWLFTDSAIVLPEYIVEFEYVPASKVEYEPSKELSKEFDMLASQLSAARQSVAANYQQIMGKPSVVVEYGSTNASELDRADLGSIKGVLVELMKSCALEEIVKNGLQCNVTPSLVKEIESFPPKLENRDKWDAITIDRLTQYTKTDLSSLSYLNLHNSGISVIENLSSLPGLKVLVLSFNSIKKIQGLEDNLQLERLEFGYNQISKIENMETLAKLRVFEINNNHILSLSDLNHLKLYNGALEEIMIRNNPFTSSKNYKAKVLAILPYLKKVDGFSVLEKDKQSLANLQKETTITKPMLVADAKFSLSSIQEIGVMDLEHSSLSSSKALPTNWEQYVEELNLSHKKIGKLELLHDFCSLRRLNLSDNKISKVEGLEGCKLLEELNLEKNKISVIEGLAHLSFLKKLEIGKNRIQLISGLDTLENLVQLSLEDNMIQSLGNFPMLKNLMELYIGNNLILDFKEIKTLKELGKLIILDISGNKVCEEMHYRLYIIFHLKKLKVLDGISIEQAEFNEARNTYAGRLTEEILETRLNGKTVKSIMELDLSGAKLRDFEGMIDEKTFPMLQELNLSSNYFASLKALGPLSKLKVLIISQNKIESLYCKQDDKGSLRGLPAIPVLLFRLNKM